MIHLTQWFFATDTRPIGLPNSGINAVCQKWMWPGGAHEGKCIPGADVTLFDSIVRTETRLKNDRESSFTYYNTSARPTVAALREVFETWFENYPEESKKELRARFRSPIEPQHEAAFFELYLHELFRGMGYTLQVHPDIAGQTTHPDYLVSLQGVPKFYLEAILAGVPAAEDAAAEARLAEALDLINKVKLPNYFIEVQPRGRPQTPVPTRKLRSELEKWLNGLDINVVDNFCKEQRFDELPRFEWTHDGLYLSFRPIPKGPAHRGNTEARPIGIVMGEVQWLNTAGDIRDAIDAKAKKYGALMLPLVLAIDVVGELYDRIDLFNALFGDEVVVVSIGPEGMPRGQKEERKRNGAWFGPNGPRNELVSGVLVAAKLNGYSVGNQAPVLVQSPYAKNPLCLPTYPLPQIIPNFNTKTMQDMPGESVGKYLRLPSPWPPTDHA